MELQFGIDDLKNPICSTLFNEEQFCLDFSQDLPDLDQLNKLGNSFSCALIDCNHAQKSQYAKLLDGPIGSKLKRIVMIPSEDFDLNESIFKLPHLQQIIILYPESDGQMVSVTGSLNKNSIEMHQRMGLKDQKKNYAGLQRLIARLGADCTLAESKVLKRTKIASDNEKVKLF